MGKMAIGITGTHKYQIREQLLPQLSLVSWGR